MVHTSLNNVRTCLKIKEISTRYPKIQRPRNSRTQLLYKLALPLALFSLHLASFPKLSHGKLQTQPSRAERTQPRKPSILKYRIYRYSQSPKSFSPILKPHSIMWDTAASAPQSMPAIDINPRDTDSLWIETDRLSDDNDNDDFLVDGLYYRTRDSIDVRREQTGFPYKPAKPAKPRKSIRAWFRGVLFSN
jgi:hypothetical protein